MCDHRSLKIGTSFNASRGQFHSSSTTSLVMQTRSSKGSVLGKRAHHVDQKAVVSASATDIVSMSQMLTPERSPKSKRARMSLSAVDGDSNKENVPPLRIDALNDPPVDTLTSIPSATRTSTEIISPSRTRSGKYMFFFT